MREQLFYIYLKKKNGFSHPLSPEDYIMFYRKPQRRAMIQNHDEVQCITWDGRILQVAEALTYLKRAEKKAEKIFFQKCFNKKDFLAYLNEYPQGHYVKEAREMIERLDLSSCRTQDDFEQYIKDYPEGKFTEEAKARLSSLQ